MNWDCADSDEEREGNGVRASWLLPSLASEWPDESLGVRWFYYLFCLTYFSLIYIYDVYAYEWGRTGSGLPKRDLGYGAECYSSGTDSCPDGSGSQLLRAEH